MELLPHMTSNRTENGWRVESTERVEKVESERRVERLERRVERLEECRAGRAGVVRLQHHIIQTDKLDRTQKPLPGIPLAKRGPSSQLIHCSKIEIDDKKTDEDIAE